MNKTFSDNQDNYLTNQSFYSTDHHEIAELLRSSVTMPDERSCTPLHDAVSAGIIFALYSQEMSS